MTKTDTVFQIPPTTKVVGILWNSMKKINNKKGFTILEVTVVIMLISILIVVATTGGNLKNSIVKNENEKIQKEENPKFKKREEMKVILN